VGESRDRAPAWDLVVVLAAKAVASFAVLRAGFFALSDDDFSRVVIAERFAAAPSLDPSGTSWLPLPFWLTGSAMAAFGRTLPVARGTALLLGLVSALLVHRAARWMGASRAGAALGGVLATTIPTAARLGVSFQPEALTAGLIVLGAAATRMDGSRRLAGAFCLGAACLCRYDAWPVAAAFSAFSVVDALRKPNASRGTLLSAALIAWVTPLVWLSHGLLAHGDALFFVHRVAAYRQALGVTETFLASLAAYPVTLVTAEPELTLGAAAVLIIARRKDRSFLATFRRPAVLLVSLLAFLVVGRLFDGAPTHHAERTLLPLWTGLAILAAEAAVRLRESPRSVLAVAVPALALAFGVAVRIARPNETFPTRAAERAIGAAARATLPIGARLLVDTADYGYFAVIAAFGAPERAEPFDRHDPRDAKGPHALSPREALDRRIAEYDATALIVPREHWQAALAVGRLIATRGDFALVEVDRASRGSITIW
jgi:hypothetical protein